MGRFSLPTIVTPVPNGQIHPNAHLTSLALQILQWISGSCHCCDTKVLLLSDSSVAAGCETERESGLPRGDFFRHPLSSHLPTCTEGRSLIFFHILWSFLDLGSWHGYFWWYGVYGCGIMVGFEVPSSSHFYPFLQKVLLPPVPCNVPGAEVSGVSGEICTTLRAWGLGKGGPLPGPGDSIPPWYACGCTVHPGIPVASILYIYSHPLVGSIYVSVSLL